MEDVLLEERKDKFKVFFKEKLNLITYLLLAVIVFLAVRIRIRNIPGLKDVSTGDWTLGPDLDPFLFLRWAKYIVENGSLFVVDVMRYVPLGINVQEEYLLHPYLLAWFHNVASWFGSPSVTYSAIIYPVFMFALTVIAFFFLSRKIFVDSLGKKKANIIGLISSFFLSIIPVLLPRTIAGIPEKESVAFLFLFLALYFFLASWKSRKNFHRIGLAFLAGVATFAMALTWGAYGYIFMIIAPSVFVAFLLHKVDKDKIKAYGIWLFTSIILMVFFAERYDIRGLGTSIFTSTSLVVFLILIVNEFLFKTRFNSYYERSSFRKLPKTLFTSLALIILSIIVASLSFGFDFIPRRIGFIIDSLVKPATSRLIQTVAENRQPYFVEWATNFGPNVGAFPLVFWMFFIASIFLFIYMINFMKVREKIILSSTYVLLLLGVVFSRYSAGSVLNGENFLSLLVYSGGFLVFLIGLGYVYYRRQREGRMDELKKVDFGLIMLFAFFFLSIISARGLIRLVMVLAAPASILVSFLAVVTVSRAINSDKKRKVLNWAVAVVVILLLVFSANSFYSGVNAQASAYRPGAYNQQWQKAMDWVRDNTPVPVIEEGKYSGPVFAHWWDYGYWIQSIGERATILDGGNAVSYWNHLMGRHVLTGKDNLAALEFLYTHDATHLLIDPTDIGKYGAFSFIGSDENLDRRSQIPTFIKDFNQVQETKDQTIYFYGGGSVLDDDIVYEENGSRIFLPGGEAGLGGILVVKDKEGNLLSSPVGIFVYNGQQHSIPFRYAFDTEFRDFGSGLESGIFLFPLASQQASGLEIDMEGALFYLSERTVKSQLVRLYLYNEENPYFELAHSEDDLLIGQLKSQNPSFDKEFLFFQGFRGPIKIWEINYPNSVSVNEDYLSKDYPDELYLA